MYLYEKCGISIDLDNPGCLYCLHKLKDVTSYADILLRQDLFVCPNCNEGYTLLIKSDTVYCAFFTCFDIEVISYLDKDDFGIKPFNSKIKDFIWVPEFFIDFSDKNTLYSKLKTYLILS